MEPGRADDYPLERRRVVAELLAGRGGMVVVTGLGAPSWDAAAAGDDPLTFPLWGAMGAAAMLGLGLALAQPERRVLVITGDGEMLMGLGALAAIGMERPQNLAVVVLDNERYGETGMQATATAGPLDLAQMAAAAGWPLAREVADEAALAQALPEIRGAAGPVFHAIKVKADEPALVMPPKDGAYLKDRFRLALLGEP